MSRKIILIKQELLLLFYELNRSGLLAENEKIRPILAQLEKLLLCDLSPSTNDAFRWIHLSTPLIRLFLLVLILLLLPTLNFLPVWFALSLLRFRLPSRLPMMFILWMVAMMVVIIPSRTV